MLDIKNKWKGAKNSIVIKNMCFLFLTQGINYLFPLITFNYLLRTIHVGNFGKISFAQALVMYFLVFVDYGFNISATNEIAKYKDDKSKLGIIFSNTIYTKLLLMFISLVALIAIVFATEKLQEHWVLYFTFFGMIIGNTLYPQWFFQGIQKMGYITIVNAFIKVLFLLSIFVFIKKESDFIYIPTLYSISYILPGIYAFSIARKYIGKMIRPSVTAIKNTLHGGFYIFVTTGLSVIFSGTAVPVLGFMSTDDIVGYYAGYEKIIKAGILLFTPITLAIYPKVSHLFHTQQNQQAIAYIRRVGIYTIGLASLFALSLIFSSKLITLILFTPDYVPYLPIFYILSLWIILSVINNFIGIQYLSGSGRSKIYSISFVIGAIITLLLLYFLTLHYSYIGTAWAAVLGEFSLTITMLLLIFMHRRR